MQISNGEKLLELHEGQQMRRNLIAASIPVFGVIPSVLTALYSIGKMFAYGLVSASHWLRTLFPQSKGQMKILETKFAKSTKNAEDFRAIAAVHMCALVTLNILPCYISFKTIKDSVAKASEILDLPARR